MSPKEKAIQLLGKFDVKHQMKFGTKKGTLPISMYESQIKQCAINCVEELICSHIQDGTDSQFYYWQDVKTELQNL